MKKILLLGCLVLLGYSSFSQGEVIRRCSYHLIADIEAAGAGEVLLFLSLPENQRQLIAHGRSRESDVQQALSVTKPTPGLSSAEIERQVRDRLEGRLARALAAGAAQACAGSLWPSSSPLCQETTEAQLTGNTYLGIVHWPFADNNVAAEVKRQVCLHTSRARHTVRFSLLAATVGTPEIKAQCRFTNNNGQDRFRIPHAQHLTVTCENGAVVQ